jgi:hypothetical protein
MTIEEMLGPGGLNLFTLPSTAMEELLTRRPKGRPLEPAYLGLTSAEMGLCVQAALGRLDWPVKVTENSLLLVEYNSDCYDYTCPRGIGEWSAVRDLCIFSSHRAKLVDIFGETPENALTDDFSAAYRLVEKAAWEFVSKDNDPDGIAKRVAMVLWHAKARIIRGLSTNEKDLADDLDTAARDLHLPARA